MDCGPERFARMRRSAEGKPVVDDLVNSFYVFPHSLATFKRNTLRQIAQGWQEPPVVPTNRPLRQPLLLRFSPGLFLGASPPAQHCLDIAPTLSGRVDQAHAAGQQDRRHSH